MPIAVSRRSTMLLYSDAGSHYSHRVRIVLAEKGVSADIIDVKINDKPEDLLHLNPYNTLPTLVDRDLVLYEPGIILEYLDERFPHPPLMPVYPVAKARTRLLMHRIESDWALLIKEMETDSGGASAARQNFTQILLSLVPALNGTKYFLSDEFSLVDCCVAPMLWRLSYWGIDLPKPQAKPIWTYAQRVFDRDTFQLSLSEVELEMQVA